MKLYHTHSVRQMLVADPRIENKHSCDSINISAVKSDTSVDGEHCHAETSCPMPRYRAADNIRLSPDLTLVFAL